MDTSLVPSKVSTTTVVRKATPMVEVAKKSTPMAEAAKKSTVTATTVAAKSQQGSFLPPSPSFCSFELVSSCRH
jgi:hypothetical protein